MTPPNKIIILRGKFAMIKLSVARKSSGIVGSSPLSLTNHPKGIVLTVYSVPVLSVQYFQIFGGIPIPNSKTLTPEHFAIVK